MSQDLPPRADTATVATRLILQGPEGFGDESHLEALKRLLRVPDTKRAILSVAYLKTSGIKLIEDDLRRLGDRVWVFAGIRNKITSRQGLALLLEFGTKLFVVDTGGCPPQVTYHPKLYLAISATQTHLVVGSSNLTMGGLKNNIEASIEVTIDPTDPDALRFQQTVEEQFDALPDRFPDNVIALTSQADLKCLSGRIADEQSASVPNHQPEDCVPMMKPRPKPSSCPDEPSSVPEKLTEMQWRYWKTLNIMLKENGATALGNKTPQRKNWMRYACRGKFSLCARMHTAENHIRVALYISGDDSKRLFEFLEERKKEIKRDLGFLVNWKKRPNGEESRISSCPYDADPKNEPGWPEQHKWLTKHLIRMHKVLVPLYDQAVAK